VIYLDRVETPAPLRFYLHPGSRVPVHCSASGKVFLAQMSPAQRRRCWPPRSCRSYTPSTLTDIEKIDQQLQQVRRDGYALDREEFLPGLVCVAVRVPPTEGGARALSNLCVALQAPVMRLSIEQALQFLPALQRAAEALGRIDAPPTKNPKANDERAEHPRPDRSLSVRDTFGIDSDLQVPAFGERDEHVPEIDEVYRFDRDTTLAILARLSCATGASWCRGCTAPASPRMWSRWRRG